MKASYPRWHDCHLFRYKIKMNNYIFDKLLVEIQISHEELVRYKTRKKEKRL